MATMVLAPLLVVLAAAPPVDVHATVVRADGTPLQGARVNVWDSSFAVDGVAFDPDGVARLWNPVTGITDAKGATSFPVPRAEAFSSGNQLAVAVTAEGQAPFFQVFEVSGGKLQVGTVKMQPGAEVELRLRCGDAPCPEGVSVQLAVDSPGRAADVRNASTDRKGAVRFVGLPPGQARAKATWKWNEPGERLGAVSFLAPAGKSPEVVLPMRSTGAGQRISGKAIDPLGKGFGWVSAQCGGVHRSAHVQQDGSFVLDDLPAGGCQVSVSEPMVYLPPEDIRSVAVTAPATGVLLRLPLQSEAERKSGARSP